MADRSETRRLPKGERCLHCGDRKYYIENGMRFCNANGHEIEGFVQFDMGEDEEAGLMGTVTRRDKEIREREKKQLTGQAGRSLYLEALQLILRNQLLWLINNKGLRTELETIVRDLWDLRLRGFGALQADMDAPEEKLEFFSSQPLAEVLETTPKSASHTESWDPNTSVWYLPRMIDTLALCYLGGLLLRIPLSVGQLSLWKDDEKIPYKLCYYDLPQEMRDRMPSHFTRALKLPLHMPTRREELHQAVLQLAFAYHHNYALTFPSLNCAALTIHYAQLLTLPVEVLQTTRFLISTLECSLNYPTHKSRVQPLDHPEILLVSMLVVSTKLCFPFEEGGDEVGRLHWDCWTKEMRAFMGINNDCGLDAKVHEFKDVTADEISSMNDLELDKYLKLISNFIEHSNGGPITKFFPKVEPPQPELPAMEVPDEEVKQRTISRLAATIKYSGSPADENIRNLTLGKRNYKTFRTSSELSGFAKEFYEITAAAAGIQLQSLVRSVYMLEQRIVIWQRGR